MDRALIESFNNKLKSAIRNLNFAILLCAFLLAPCFPAQAQRPGKVRKIGLLTPRSPSDSALWHQAFRQGLRELGWVEGQNVAIEYRYAQGKRDRLPDLAAELLRINVEVVVVVSVLRLVPSSI